MKLELSIEREIELMNKYQLTADELFTIKLIFIAQDGHSEYLTQFFSNNKLTNELIDILKSLQDKGIINKTYKIPNKGTIFNPQDVDFNQTVLKSMYQHSQDMGMELFMNYPAFTTINGKQFSLRNITKLYKSLDEFCFAYGKTIKFNKDTHKEIMDLLEYAKDNNLLHSGICDFVASMQWLTLQEIKNGDYGTFETNELI